MSFFEKMMRINQTKNSKPFLHQQQKDNDHTDNQNEFQQSNLSKITQQKMQNKLGESRNQQQLPDVPQQPKIQPVYMSIKPALITCLLPKKQQLLRDMLAKKRQFNMKKLTNSNINKGVELKQRLQQSSTKFIQSTQPLSKKQLKLNQKIIQSNDVIVSNANLTQFRAPLPATPINRVSVDKFKKKELKQSIVLDLSNNSSQKQSLCFNNNMQNTSSNPFERQIMMRLINLLENERHDRKDMMAMSMTLNHQYNHQPHQEKEKDCPIIINNILKTPIDKLNKDLMEREMKIRMLQNNRSKQKYSFNLSNLPFTEVKDDNLLTQRSQYTNKCNEFNTLIGNHQNNKKTKMSIQLSRISVKDKKQQIIKVQSESTKPSSNFTSQMHECEDDFKQKKPRERDFNRNKNIKKEEGQNIKLQAPQQKSQLKPNVHVQKDCSNAISETIIHKAAVRLDIPLDQPNQTQGLSLAEAFKRRIGKLKSQKQKQAKKLELSQKADAKSTITQIYNEYKTPKQKDLFTGPLQNSQVLNLVKQGKAKKASISSKNSITLREQKQNNTSSKKSRQPSKQLIDRLIGGERAKISKKQMYALTRKNYQNLPEIQAKKKQEEKIKLERQRLAKIKQLQKSTRTLRRTKMPIQ